MSSSKNWDCLKKLRVGCVKYLNSQPLICAYDGPVFFEHPAALSTDLAEGELDVALIPAFHALTDPDYVMVDDVAIACDGPVFSVVLAYEGELTDISKVEFDPASLSSVHLLRVILAEFYGITPTASSKGNPAKLLIGNQAIEYREIHARESGRKFLDLGEEWKKQTGLPFVFAMWAMHKYVTNIEETATAFRSLKSEGIKRIPKIVQKNDLMDVAFRTRYLTEHIRFDMGDREKAGLAKYRELLFKYGHIDHVDFPIRFV